MTNDRKLMQMALDALEEAQDYTSCPTYSPSMTQQCATAAVALRARLAQPEREWQGLTDEEYTTIMQQADHNAAKTGSVFQNLRYAIEAKLKEKNT
jgi:uncharacterized protein YukE